jgi:hypothetical protein
MNIFGKLTSKQKSAINFFADKLFTPQMKRNISIHISFSSTMDNYGETEIDDYNLSGKPREFILNIKRNISDDEIIHTIAHEMVHVKQYVYGQLNEQMTTWNGKKVNDGQYGYFDSPWEIEAHQLGDILFYEYRKKHL